MFNKLSFTTMEDFFDILKIILPAGIVFITAYYLVKKFLDEDINKKNLELKLKTKSTTLPIRLQAFERITLFLERINPNSMIMRANRKLPSSIIQAELLKIVRSEFEHNLAQQIYMKKKTWDAVVKAKEETIKLINITSTKVKPESSGMEFAQTLLALTSQLKSLPSAEPLALIKKEVAREM
jgi:hypothetical protein